jgi:hypothetical protein
VRGFRYVQRVQRCFTPAAILLLAFAAACGSPSRDALVRDPDAGADAGDAAPDGPLDAGADADPSLGAPCTDDPQCDDHVTCTFDACDPAAHRCRNTPDDAQCDDGIYCNGRERCVPARGCGPGPVATCSDDNACTIDRCVEATKSCAHAPRDADGDGDPDDHCVTKRDCDDLDPTVSSTRAEVCANGKDDDCNGAIDEAPCATAANDTCATAPTITAPGTYAFKTTAAKKDYTASCGVTTPAAAHDVVALVTIPAGAPRDIDVWATSAMGETAIALQRICGDPASELGCNAGGTTARARGRSLEPGTYAAIVTTQVETTVELQVDMPDATARPTNESCATPGTIVPETSKVVSIVDAAKDLASACSPIMGELTYALTLAEPADVRIFGATLRGNGAPVIGLRNAHCADEADELRCRIGAGQPLFARGLAAGTYVVTVAASAPIDATVLVKTYPPTTAPPGQTCAAPPAIVPNVRTPIDLSNAEDAINDGCLAGGPDVAFDLALPVTSDVLLVGRFPQNEVGGVALDAPSCKVDERLLCGIGSTPVRTSKRAVPAGDYRVVVTDLYGANDSVVAYVRPTAAPIAVTGADTCAAAIDIPPEGGFFTGDTTAATPTCDDGCDAPSPPGGAPDQVLRLVLTEPKHVVLSMDGSTYTTIVDVRQGPTCPGTEVAGACYVGFSGARSFLDIDLPASTYWIVIDGYAGDKGPWNLDVRVLPP